MQRAVPDIGDGAGEQRPGLAPVRAVVVRHAAGALRLRRARLVAPGRVVVHAIGRVGDHQVRAHAAEQPGHVVGVGGVAAEQPVRTEMPEVARAADGIGRRLGRRLLAVLRRAARQQRIQRGPVEAEVTRVDAELAQVRQLQPQQLPVPARLLGEPVVGKDVGPLLRVGEVTELDHRHRSQPQLARRQHAPMPRDDAVRAVDEHRVVEPELPDRARDQRNLRVRMRPGVAGVGDERRDRPVLDRTRAVEVICNCLHHDPPLELTGRPTASSCQHRLSRKPL